MKSCWSHAPHLDVMQASAGTKTQCLDYKKRHRVGPSLRRSIRSVAHADAGNRNLELRVRSTFYCLCAVVLLAAPANATWKPEYAETPPEVQEWYRNAELTDAAKFRFPFKKCCDHADVVKTQFRVNKTTNGDEWYWLDGAEWRRISADIIHWGRTAPNRQPTLFIYSGKETCFFPGDSGI
jgi:hypothetical protein